MSALSVDEVLKRSRASSLERVLNLNCWGAGLAELTVLRQLPNLQVLNISCNAATSLRDVGACSRLTELYARCNGLSSFAELDHLQPLKSLRVNFPCIYLLSPLDPSLCLTPPPLVHVPTCSLHCPTPKVLWLCGNPLSAEPGYRLTVIRKLPQLTKLDNQLVSTEELPVSPGPPTTTRPNILHAVLCLLAELAPAELQEVRATADKLLGHQV